MHEVKQDPITGTIAQRTVFDGARAYKVFSLANKPPHYVAAEDVSDWVDLVPAQDTLF